MPSVTWSLSVPPDFFTGLSLTAFCDVELLLSDGLAIYWHAKKQRAQSQGWLWAAGNFPGRCWWQTALFSVDASAVLGWWQFADKTEAHIPAGWGLLLSVAVFGPWYHQLATYPDVWKAAMTLPLLKAT